MSPGHSDQEAPYRWGRLSAEHLHPWTDLANLLARVDRTEDFFEPEDLGEDLTSASVDPEQDTWAIWAGDELVGFGEVFVPTTASYEGTARTYLLGGIHPDHRGQGLGRALIERQETRGLALARERHPERAVAWVAEGGLEGADVRGLLEHRGYAVARYFLHMVRGVPGDPVQAAPEGAARLISPGPEMFEPLRLVHNVAFRDHWGSGERSPEAWQEGCTSRTARLQLSSVAVDDHGQPLSYVLCAQWVPRELYVDAVGTVPDARGRGLARACLTRSIELATASGDYDRIDLGVDSASETGATRLYERLGFTVDKTFASYRRAVDA